MSSSGTDSAQGCSGAETKGRRPLTFLGEMMHITAVSIDVSYRS